MDIVDVDIEALIPDPENARTHDDKNLAAIRGSIKQFDVVEPLVVQRSSNIVLGGNGRLEVLKSLGHKTVPVHYVDLDDKKAKALALALNRTAELADWNMDRLKEQLAEIDEPELIGFNDDFKPINPNEIDPEDAFGNLGEGDKDDDIEQITFTLSGAQADFVRDVIKDHVGILDEKETGNPNKNGNALYAALGKI